MTQDQHDLQPQLEAQIKALQAARARDNISFKELLGQRDVLLEALRWIAVVDAAEREYQAKAKAALRAVEKMR